jgi:hypothetical protein
LRVVLFLKQHRHEPVFQPKLARAEDAPAKRVVLQRPLAGEHGVAHPLACGQRPVKRINEAARGLDQHAVAHGDHGGDADLQQLGGDGFGRLFGLRGLAGFEEDQRDAVIAQQRAECVGENGRVPALFEFDGVPRLLEAQPAETDAAVVDAVTVEMDDVIGLSLGAGAVQFLAQGRQRGQIEHVELDQAGQGFHRLDQRQRADAMVEVVAGVVLRSGSDQQDADGRGDHRRGERLGSWEPAANAGRLRALKQKSLAVVQQFPRQAEQSRCSFPGGEHLGFRCVGFGHRIDMDGEAATRTSVDPRPGVHDIRGVGYGDRGFVQALAPFHEIRFDLPRPLPEIVARPDGISLQIPAQLLRLDGAERRDEAPTLRAVDVRLTRRGGFVDQAGAGGSAANAIHFLKLQVGQFENEFLQRLGLRLRLRGHIGGQPLAHGDQDCVHRRFDAARVAAHREVNRLLAEELPQHAELGAVQRERDDGEDVFAALFPDAERVAQFLADPSRLQRIRADHDRVGRGGVDGFLDLQPQRIATAQLAGIDPARLAVIGERRAQFSHEGVVLRAVGDEELGHGG